MIRQWRCNHCLGSRALLLGTALALIGTSGSWSRIIITEVVPGVTLSQTDGDKVELFNTGPGAVDLTGWVLTDFDLDLDGTEADPLLEGSFAPASLSVPILMPGEFCVITFVDPAAPTGDNQSATLQSYGFDISVELDPDFRRSNDQVGLVNPAGVLVDSVVYGSTAESSASDIEGDASALTVPDNFGYGVGTLTQTNAWAGPDTISNNTNYQLHAVPLAPPLDAETPTGSGSIQRINVGSTWMEGIPDGGDFFVVEPVASASLGSHTFSSTDGMLAPLTLTDDLEQYIIDLDDSANGGPKLADGVGTDDFVVPSNVDRVQFRRVIDLMLAGDYASAHFFADQLGYEVVAWTDSPGTGDLFYVLQEQADVGDPGFRGLGTYVFDNSSINDMCIQVPHPIFDSLTLREGANMLVQVRPRFLAITGTHRQNSTMDTPCDGTFMSGAYPISDVAHSVITFFQMAHEQFVINDPTAYTLQLHGFGATLSTYDVILSEGVNYTPPEMNFIQVLENKIDAQMFMADGTDLTDAAVFSEDETVLGATTNTQGRFTNGVQWALACEDAAQASNAHFIHMEQDLDVRQENQHIIDALIEALGMLGIPAGLTLFGEMEN